LQERPLKQNQGLEIKNSIYVLILHILYIDRGSIIIHGRKEQRNIGTVNIHYDTFLIFWAECLIF